MPTKLSDFAETYTQPLLFLLKAGSFDGTCDGIVPATAVRVSGLQVLGSLPHSRVRGPVMKVNVLSTEQGQAQMLCCAQIFSLVLVKILLKE